MPSAILVLNISALKLRQPEYHLISINLVDVFFFVPKLRAQVLFFFFQLSQSIHEGVGRDALLDSLGDVVDTLFDFCNSGGQFGNACVFFQIPVGLCHSHVGQFFDHVIGKKRHGVLGNNAFDIVFPQGFFATSGLSFS